MDGRPEQTGTVDGGEDNDLAEYHSVLTSSRFVDPMFCRQTDAETLIGGDGVVPIGIGGLDRPDIARDFTTGADRDRTDRAHVRGGRLERNSHVILA